MTKLVNIGTILLLMVSTGLHAVSGEHQTNQSAKPPKAELVKPVKASKSRPAKVELVERLQRMDTVTANFVQTSIDKSGRRKIEKGDMQLKRPNRFRWNITTPFNQGIIAKGGKLWILDPDFKQVVIKKQDNQVGPTAVQLLSGNADQFLAEYNVTLMNYGPEAVYTMKPVDSSELFEKLEIHFSRDQFSAISIVDSLGGKRRIDFTKVAVNQSLSDDLFDINIDKLKAEDFDIVDEGSE